MTIDVFICGLFVLNFFQKHNKLYFGINILYLFNSGGIQTGTREQGLPCNMFNIINVAKLFLIIEVHFSDKFLEL